MTPTKKYSYAEASEWSDVEPIPQDDGGPDALAQIAYTDEYRESMSYLRAIMANNEFSERVLQLTDHCIGLNPAHYTVWLYRAKCLDALSSDLHVEMVWLNAVSLKHIKNYQIWHHRQHVITLLDDSTGEADFVAQMLEKDAKNYHVWSYRQWLVKHFALWDDVHEMEEVERWLRRDIRNNSAWNHRWFLVFGRYDKSKTTGLPVSEEILEREMDFAKNAIEMAPQNESAWNYLRGLLKQAHKPIHELKDFAERFANINEDEPDQRQIRSSHALDVLADAYAEEAAAGRRSAKDAQKAYQLLSEKYDPIRANYWNWRSSHIKV